MLSVQHYQSTTKLPSMQSKLIESIDPDDQKIEWQTINPTRVHPTGDYKELTESQMQELRMNIYQYDAKLDKSKTYELWHNVNRLSARCLGVMWSWKITAEIVKHIKNTDDIDDFTFRPLPDNVSSIVCLYAPNQTFSATAIGCFSVFYSMTDFMNVMRKGHIRENIHDEHHYLVCTNGGKIIRRNI